MKKAKVVLVSALATALAFQSAYAVTIDSARLNRDTGEIEVEGISAGVGGSRVTLRVTAGDQEVYLDETMSGSEGKYIFAFKTDAATDSLSVKATDSESEDTETVAYYSKEEIDAAYKAVKDAISGKDADEIWSAVKDNAEVLGFNADLVEKLSANTNSRKFAAEKLADIFKENSETPCKALEEAFTESAVYGLVKYNKELSYLEKNYPDLFEKAREDLFPDDKDDDDGGSSGGGSGSGGGGNKKPSTSTSGGPNVDIPPITDVKEQTYDDVPTDYWAFDYIERLSDKGVISGDGTGNFNPENNITREEFVKIIVSAFGITSDNAIVSFNDVSSYDWFYNYIRIAVGEGIINGISESEFGAGQNITRQDLATIVKRVCDLKGIYTDPDEETTTFADDAEIAEYAKAAVALLKNKGIIEGKGDNVFAPNDYATRAECAKIVYQIIK